MPVTGIQSATSNFLNTTIKRNEIKEVIFVDSINIPAGNASWDVSALQDSSVMVWYDTASLSPYVITIEGEGIVEGNLNSNYLFESLINVTKLDLTHFDTLKVTNMSSVFRNMYRLTNLDLRKVDFSLVTSYDYMLSFVPTTAKITVKDATARAWLNSRFPEYTNILIAS